jgi:DNA-binding SARP family transcriptional activator/tetratricopeptide (TPR) repeat protein
VTRVEFHLLGPFEVRLNGRRVSLPTRQAEFLLAALALQPDRQHQRDRLATLLWGNRSDEQARVSFRQALYRIRHALSEAEPLPIEVDARTVRLDGGKVWSDLATLEATGGSDPVALEQALALVRGDLLEGLNSDDADAETWLMGERARVRRVVAARSALLCDSLLAERRIDEAGVLARRQLALDPYDEAALRLLMRTCALQNRRNAALETYREFAHRLRVDLSVAPAEETEALFRQIRSGEVAPVPEQPAPSTSLAPDPAATRREGPSERRTVTVVHARVPALAGVDDPEYALREAVPLRGALEAALGRHGGQILPSAPDEVAAVFGASGDSEASCIEAARAALAIVALGPGAAIGLHSDEAIVGERSEFSGLFLAARAIARKASEGEVVMSSPAARLSEGYFSSEEGPIVEGLGSCRVITGTSEARNSWQARAERVLSPFAGRDHEIQEMLRAFERLDSGARVLLLSGEAGLGKSRLVHEFLSRPELQGCEVLRTGVAVFDAGATHSALGTLLRDWAGIEPGDSRETIDRRVSERLGPSADADLAPVQLLLDLPVTGSAWDRLAPAQQRRRIADALASILLREAASAPTVLVFEDAHWIDPVTAEILGTLISRLGGAPVLVVVTARPEFQPDWIGRSFVQRIRLEPLDRAATDRITASLVDAERSSLREALHQRSGGVPLFLEEMVRDLKETRGQRGDQVGTPATVRAVIAARIERLPPPDRSVLQIASVIGVEVPQALLAPLVGDRVDLDQILARLSEAELLYRVRGKPDVHAFKHALTQDTAYRSLLIADRKPLHARLLDLAEAHWSERRSEHVDRLAEHAWIGEAWDRAAGYLTEAGERAVQHCNFQRARILFERAIEALRRLPPDATVKQRMAAIHLGMRAVLNMTGEYADVTGHLDAAASLADEVGNDALRCQVQIHMNYFYNTIGEFERCHVPASEAETLAARTGDPLLVSEAALARGQLLRLMGDYHGAASVIGPQLDRWLGELRHHRGGHLGTRSIWALGHIALSSANLGELDDAGRQAGQALAIAQETGRPTDLQFAIHHTAIVDRMAGRLEAAIQAYRNAVDIVRAADLAYFHFWIAANFGETLLAAGQIEEARQVLEFAVAATEVGPLSKLSPRAAIALGRAQHLAGLAAEAEATLRGVVEKSGRLGQPALQVAALHQLAETLSAGDEAATLRAEAERRLVATPPDPRVAATRHRLIGVELCLPI